MRLDLRSAGISEEEILKYAPEMEKADELLMQGVDGFNGWTTLPEDYDRQELERIIRTAEKIRDMCEALVVIGIGGSYLGARACIEMMQNSFNMMYDSKERKLPLVVFAGHNISAVYHRELIAALKDRDIALCVISKSGTTAEPNIVFSVFRELVYEKYGEEEARKRIFAITDAKKGVLRQQALEEGYESFTIPDDIGGRYSVLTPVGLLPIAAAGIDVKEILRGAADAMREYAAVDMKTNICLRYAAARYILDKAGKSVEIYECYEPKLYYFCEWLKQLFGESEGKDGRGIFPTQLQFTTDLHSMGQFVQQGSQIFFETVLNVENTGADIVIPNTAEAAFGGRTMAEVNRAAVRGVIAAHSADKIPVILIDIPEISPYFFGKMVYFFERSCALKGYMMGINPFDQPGVEKYKAYMKEALNE